MQITMYTTDWCPYCIRAKAFLQQKGLAFEEINLADDPHFREKIQALTGGWTVPQIVIGDTPIGGYDELRRLDKAGELDRLLAAA
jgi:glutaredoxin 3